MQACPYPTASEHGFGSQGSCSLSASLSLQIHPSMGLPNESTIVPEYSQSHWKKTIGSPANNWWPQIPPESCPSKSHTSFLQLEAIATDLIVQSLMLAGPYESYPGSPVSKGILQHDMWGVKPPSSRWDWDGLRQSIAQHGVRNSLLLAPMPTASTSQVTCT